MRVSVSDCSGTDRSASDGERVAAVRSGWMRAAPDVEFVGRDAADLAVVVVDVLDWSVLRGSPLAVHAAAAMERGVPCVVLAGQVLAGRRELGAIGVDAAHALDGDPLDVAAERLARRWTR